MKRSQDGQALVEFVLALPVFLLVLSFIWDIGLRAWSAVSLQHAAQVACRAYAVNLPQEPDQALNIALSAARRACHGPAALRITQLSEVGPFRGQALSDHNEYRDHGPSTRQLRLTASLRRVFRLPGMPAVSTLVAHASILDEDTQERARAD